MQPLAAGDEQAHPAAGVQYVRKGRRRVGHVLEVVDHEEELTVAEARNEILARAHSLRDRGNNRLGRFEGAEVDEADAVREPVEELGRDFQREARLAHSAGAGHCDQSGRSPTVEAEHVGQLLLATDEWRRELREPRLVESAERRKGRFTELEDHDRGVEVLQAVLAEAPQLSGVTDELSSRRGNEHLAAVTRRRDPRGAMHVEAHIALIRCNRLPGVHAHAHADRVAGQGLLACFRRSKSVTRAFEGDKEGIALGVDLATSMLRERRPQLPAMVS
jgi:hypothetical protein